MSTTTTTMQGDVFIGSQRIYVFQMVESQLAADFQWNTLDADLVDFVYPQRYSVLTAAATSFEFPRVKVRRQACCTLMSTTGRKRSGKRRRQKRIHAHLCSLVQTVESAGAEFPRILQTDFPDAYAERPVLHVHRQQIPETRNTPPNTTSASLYAKKISTASCGGSTSRRTPTTTKWTTRSSPCPPATSSSGR